MNRTERQAIEKWRERESERDRRKKNDVKKGARYDGKYTYLSFKLNFCDSNIEYIIRFGSSVFSTTWFVCVCVLLSQHWGRK